MRRSIRSSRMIAVALVLTLSLGLVPAPVLGSARGSTAPRKAPTAPRHDHPGLDTRLAGLAEQGEAADASALKRLGKESGLDTDGRFVRVIVEAEHGKSVTAAASAKKSGGEVEGVYEGRVQAYVPIGRLHALARSEGVSAVRAPATLIAQATSEGVADTNADARHANGNDGAGVKIGIIDGGFGGLAEKLGNELPASVTRWGQGSLGLEGNGSDTHGTAVGEIVCDMAPAANLYLAQVKTEVEVGLAKDWMVANGVRVINMSLGTIGTDPGDGTGFMNGIVDSAVASGVFWANSAGNERQYHWGGDWSDPNDDSYGDFVPGDDSQNFYAEANDIVGAVLTWRDSWTAASQDYDLGLYFWDGSQWAEVAFSDNTQDGSSGCTPTEQVIAQLPETGVYSWVLYKYKATKSNVDFDLFDLITPLEHQVAAGSIVVPADNASNGFMAAAAVGRAPDYAQEEYSSEGPTKDGRIAPEIGGPSSVQSSVFGTFAGTSASSPHVAGAAALVLEKHGWYSPGAVEDYLSAAAKDVGTPGLDNQTGHGALWLPTLDANEPVPLVWAPPVEGTLNDATPAIVYEVELKGNDDLAISLECSTDAPVAMDIVDPLGAPVVTGAEATATVTASARGGWYRIRFYKTGADGVEGRYSFGWDRIESTIAAVKASPAVTEYGSSTTVQTTLKDSWATPLGGKSVKVQRSSDGRSWSTYKTVTTSSDGTASFSFTPKGKTYFRATYAGSAGVNKPCEGAAYSVNRYAYLTKPSVPSKVARDTYFTAKGYLKPKHTSGSSPVRIKCYRSENGEWVYYKSVYAKASTYSSTTSRYTKSIKLSKAGKWRFVASVTGDSLHAATTSSYSYTVVNPTTLSISADRETATYYRSVKLSGRLRDRNGNPLGGRSVLLEYSTDGSNWTYKKTLTSSSKGLVTASVRPDSKTYYRFHFTGTSTQAASASSKQLVKVRDIYREGEGSETLSIRMTSGKAMILFAFDGFMQVRIAKSTGATLAIISGTASAGEIKYAEVDFPESGTYTFEVSCISPWAFEIR